MEKKKPDIRISPPESKVGYINSVVIKKEQFYPGNQDFFNLIIAYIRQKVNVFANLIIKWHNKVMDKQDKTISKRDAKSRVLTSEAFKEIMAKYELCGRQMPTNVFYRRYVQKLDGTITLRMWKYFSDKIKTKVVAAAESLLAKYQDSMVNEIMLEEASLKKILFIGDQAMTELINDPEKLAQIPIKQRMQWVFNSMKARDSRMGVLIKKKGEERKQTLTEELIAAAQYGAVDGEVLGEDELENELDELEDKLEDKESPILEDPKPIIKPEEPVAIQFAMAKQEFHAEEGEEL